MKQLLVPTDLSEESKSFFSYAFNFAAVMDAGITIVHSFHPQPASLDGMLLVDADLQRLQEQSFNEYVQEVMEENASHEIPVEKQFLVGFAADTILEYADESRAYMILMNTTGKRMLKKFFGSVSTDVMQRAEVPVLLVPPAYEYSLIKHVVYADDFTANHDKGMIYMEHLVKEFLADLLCAHVADEDETQRDGDWIDLSQLKTKFSGVRIDQFTVTSSSAMKGLLDVADKYNSDLIIMPSKKKGFVYNLFHQSVTRQITLESKIPILVIH